MTDPVGPIGPAGPAARRQRRYGAPRNWREQFLAALADSSSVTAAAAAAQISVSHVYAVKRDDRAFAESWLLALCEGYDRLEMEILGRLRAGESRDAALRFDHAAALRLLQAHRGSRVRQIAEQAYVTAEEVRASIEAKLALLRDEVLEREAAEQAAAGPDPAGTTPPTPAGPTLADPTPAAPTPAAVPPKRRAVRPRRA